MTNFLKSSLSRLFLAGALAVTGALAQSTTGALIGTVTDSSGASIAGAGASGSGATGGAAEAGVFDAVAGPPLRSGSTAAAGRGTTAAAVPVVLAPDGGIAGVAPLTGCATGGGVTVSGADSDASGGGV